MPAGTDMPQPCAFWLTGLPAAGKTTLAMAVADHLRGLGHPVCILDGDDLRRGLNANLEFSEADREENVRRAAEVARLVLDSGIFVVAALISPYRSGRALARALTGADRFVEVFVDTPLAVCQQRDPKNLYAMARSGEITGLTGIDAPYEAPQEPELRLRSDKESPAALADRVIRYIKEAGRL